jgi:hypothetical protein
LWAPHPITVPTKNPPKEVSKFATVKPAPDEKTILSSTNFRELEKPIREENGLPEIDNPGSTLENKVTDKALEVYFCPNAEYYWILKSEAKKFTLKSSGRPKKFTLKSSGRPNKQ